MTYVILEQERCFERHLDVLLAWLRPGMTMIDIGANVGVYAKRRICSNTDWQPQSSARRDTFGCTVPHGMI